MNEHCKFILIALSCISISCALTTVTLFVFFDDDDNIQYSTGMNATVSIDVFSKSQKIGSGTGFSINYDGMKILTNAHVIFQSTSIDDDIIIVSDINKNQCKATVLYFDTSKDVAVLTLDSSNLLLKPLTLDTSNLKYGQIVFTCSNARGYGISVQNGVISIPNLIIHSDDVERLSIQTTIPLNSGSSGAPLVNENGNVVGMMSFRMKDETGNIVQGLSYAIPSSTLLEILYDVKNNII